MSLRDHVAAMALDIINTPEHWHDRAQNMRTLAEHMMDEAAKATMLGIAVDHERLAKRAEDKSGREEGEFELTRHRAGQLIVTPPPIC